jgi:fructuronate reductase
VAPGTRIVSLTITEKGYCHDAASGQLDTRHPDIAADLAWPARPTSAIGYIVAALARRRDAGLAPFTVLSCDNLLDNGGLLKRLVLDLAARRDPALAQWIAVHGKFPATMVDRIVPAATPTDVADAAMLIGLRDAAALSHEPFLQWVIEDDFVGGERPDWTRGGAEFVHDVAPYERMKLRMLNAAHSALAYLGYLAGYQTIGEAQADPAFAAYCDRLWRSEAIPMLSGIARPALEHYATTLAQRFANPSIRHRTWQIAMDGSLKLPVRIVPTIMALRSANLPAPCHILAIAAWMRYVGGRDEFGAAIDVRDPLATTLRAALDAAGDTPEGRVSALLAFDSIFPPALAADSIVRHQIVAAYTALLRDGARAAVKRIGG